MRTVQATMTPEQIVHDLRYALHEMTGPLRARITEQAFDLLGHRPYTTPEEVFSFEGSVPFEVEMVAWFQREHFPVLYRLLDEAMWVLDTEGLNAQEQVRRACSTTDIWRVVNAINGEVIPALVKEIS
jgi:hypothetical protein